MIAADIRPMAFVIWTLGLLAYYAYVDDFGKSFPKAISNEQLAKPSLCS